MNFKWNLRSAHGKRSRESIEAKDEIILQRMSSEVTGKQQKYTRIGPREFVPFKFDDITFDNVVDACQKNVASPKDIRSSYKTAQVRQLECHKLFRCQWFLVEFERDKFPRSDPSVLLVPLLVTSELILSTIISFMTSANSYPDLFPLVALFCSCLFWNCLHIPPCSTVPCASYCKY